MYTHSGSTLLSFKSNHQLHRYRSSLLLLTTAGIVCNIQIWIRVTFKLSAQLSVVHYRYQDRMCLIVSVVMVFNYMFGCGFLISNRLESMVFV